MAKDTSSAVTSKGKQAKREPTPESTPSESDYSTDSTDDTIEDEDGEELTPAMDAAILRTLAKIRKKEGVYGTDRVLEAELEAARAAADKRGLAARNKERAEKPFLLKDLHRKNLLEGVDSENEDDDDQPMTNAEAARRARDDALSAFAKFAEEDSDDDEVLKKRERGADEEAEDDAAYREFLLEMGGGEQEVRAALGMADAPITDYREDEDEKDGKKKKKKDDDEVSEEKRQKREAKRAAKRAKADEDFLMDYILNRGWIDREKAAVPTYDDIVGRPGAKDEDGESEDDEEHPWGKIDEEEEFDEKAEEFETEYNFRFEEPGSSTIVTHPRQIATAVRREDDSRKLKRQARAERKAAEKAAREEETNKKKDAKRREMEGQLNALKKELGDDVDWSGVEKILEGEWDEAEWERVVGAMLAGKYEDDDEKPSWDDGLGDEFLDAEDQEDEADPEDAAYTAEPENWEQDAWAGEPEDEDAPMDMDADFVGFDEPKRKKESKKDKKKRKAAEAAAAEAAANTDLSVAERAAKMKAAADELRALDHEDEVGGLRTRFKYTRTAPQSFGLTTEEILLATDAELNSLVSFKHMQPYRRGGIGRAGVGLGRRVRELKAKIARRKWGEEGEREVQERPRMHIERQGPGGANAMALGKRREREGGEGGEAKRAGKRLGKKERQKLAAAAAAGEGGEVQEPEAKRRKTEEPVSAPPAVELAEGAGEGKKRRRKKKKGGAEA